MAPGFWFWLIMVIWLLVGLWRDYEAGKPYPYWRASWYFWMFVLFVILGWHSFGNPFDALVR